MSLLYLNTGYSNMFPESSFTTVKSFVYNEKNGVSVTDGQSTVRFTETPSVLCGKLDIYSVSDSLDGLRIIIGDENYANGFNIAMESSQLFYQCYNLDAHSISYLDLFIPNSLNSLWFYIIPSHNDDAGAIQIALNNELVFDTNDEYAGFGTKPIVRILSNNLNLYLSNFIFCDQQFDPYSEVIVCLTTIITDMNQNGQDYIATSVNQTLFHKLNLSEVSNTYGKQSEVKGFCILNAYSAPMAPYIKLLGVESKNDSYVTKQEFDLKDSTSGCINYSEIFTRKMTLESLNKRSYGWAIQG